MTNKRNDAPNCPHFIVILLFGHQQLASIMQPAMSPPQSSHTWLITGASQGLGLAIAMSALKAGHKVIAGARNSRKAAELHPEMEMSGGRWLELDVNSVDVHRTIESAVKQAGNIDVVVNNAGYFLPGTIEDLEYV